jgi:hypothetical protein
VAAFSTPDPKADARGEKPVERLRLLRPLGAPSVPTWAALDASVEGSERLVVAGRARRRVFDDADIADWIRDARRLEALDHPNVARVRDVIIRSDEVLVVTEYVDGVRWSELAAAAPPPPLETALRVLVDVLAGLNALHNLRDATREPLRLLHGALTPETLVVGLDGVTRLVGAARPRGAAAHAGGSAYLAPEVLLEDDTADARADTYGVGVMLWEALSGAPFLPDLQPAAIVTHLLSGRAPPVTAPASAPWAAPLVDVVKRAMSPDPAKRFASASAMAAELRRVAGAKLPAPGRVGSAVRAAFGDVVRARRAELEQGVVRAPRATEAAAASGGELASEVVAEPEEASQTAPTVPPPGPVEDVSAKTAGGGPSENRTVGLALPPTVPAFAPVAPPPKVPALVPVPLPAPTAISFTDTTAAAPAAPTATAVATPIAVATPFVGNPPSPRPGAALRLAAARVAFIAIGSVAWWLAARGSPPPASAEHGIEPRAASASVAATGSVEATGAPVSGEPPAPAASTASPDEPAPPAPARVVPRAVPAPAQPPAPRSAASPPRSRPPRAATRGGYDPQGI